MRFEVTLILSLRKGQVALGMHGQRLGVKGWKADPKAFSRSLVQEAESR